MVALYLQVTKKLLIKTGVGSDKIKGIGISYQMHGLMLIDKNQKVLRPSIIWCDSRTVAIGNKTFSGVGEVKCISNLLNSPGDFSIEQKIYKLFFDSIFSLVLILYSENYYD